MGCLKAGTIGDRNIHVQMASFNREDVRRKHTIPMSTFRKQDDRSSVSLRKIPNAQKITLIFTFLPHHFSIAGLPECSIILPPPIKHGMDTWRFQTLPSPTTNPNFPSFHQFNLSAQHHPHWQPTSWKRNFNIFFKNTQSKKTGKEWFSYYLLENHAWPDTLNALIRGRFSSCIELR